MMVSGASGQCRILSLISCSSIYLSILGTLVNQCDPVSGVDLGSDITESPSPCAGDRNAKFVGGQHQAHCLCLNGYACVGSKCSAAHSNRHIGVSGYRVDCLDCVCSFTNTTLAAGDSESGGEKNITPTGDMILVTAASANHVCPLLSLLHSISVQLVSTVTLVVIYDLNPKPPYMHSEDLSKVGLVDYMGISHVYGLKLHRALFNAK